MYYSFASFILINGWQSASCLSPEHKNLKHFLGSDWKRAIRFVLLISSMLIDFVWLNVLDLLKWLSRICIALVSFNRLLIDAFSCSPIF